MSDSSALTRKRNRLREFQANLADRLRVAAAAPQDGHSKLGVLMGTRRWLVSLAEAGEIVSVPAITTVPMTLPWFRGLANVRGNLLSVVDVPQFSGQAPIVLDKDSRLLAFNQRLQFNGALVISRMLGLRNVTQMTLQSATVSGSAWIGETYQDNDGELWTELKIEQLMSDEHFLRVGKYLAV